MEYRQLPHGTEREKFGVLGLGLGGIGKTPADEIEAIIRKALDRGINYFDLCTAGATYAPFGRAIAGKRDRVFIQVHFGAVYDENGEYGWCRDFDTIQKTFLWELETLGTDYVDFGFLHCVDEDADFDKLVEIGVLDYLKALKAQGTVRHIGFSSHTPSVANRILDTGLVDMMMFSINPAYDFEKGDEWGIGSVKERFDLFKRCKKEGVGISVMKPFFAGQLLSAEHSPFGQALSRTQCLQYALDRARRAGGSAGGADHGASGPGAGIPERHAGGEGLFRYRRLHGRHRHRDLRVLQPLPALPGGHRHRPCQ